MHGEKRGRIPYSRLKCFQVPPMFKYDLHGIDDVLARLRLSRLHLWNEKGTLVMTEARKYIVMISVAILIVIQHPASSIAKPMQLAMEFSFHRGTIANVTNPLPSPQPRYHNRCPKIINTSTYTRIPNPRADVTNSITVTEPMGSSSMHA